MKILNSTSLCLIAILFVNVQILQAQKKVDYGGYFEVGGKVKYNYIYVQSFYKVKLEYKLKINDITKVEIDIRGDSEDRQIELYEGSASFKINKNFEFEIGDLKKRYGLEEETSREKLPFVEESMINAYLEPLGFVSRDPGLQIHWNDDNEITKVTGGVHFNESHRTTLMTLIKRKNFWGLDKVGASFQLALESDNELPNTWIANINTEKDFGFVNCEIEFFTGQDPNESYYRRIVGEDGKVNYFGSKALLTKKIFFDSDFIKCIEPLFLGSFLSKDTDHFDINSIQLLAGFNIYFDEKIRLMINGDLILTNHSYYKKERTIVGSNVVAQFQIRW